MQIQYTTMKHYWQAKINFDVDVLIPENGHFYTLNEILDSLDYSCLYANYNHRWRRFYPHELFKIIVFAYLKGKYSARDIEEACKTDIRFMAILNGSPAPDHATIARFQNGKLVSVIENLFLQFNIQSKGGRNPLPPVILLNSYHFFNSKNLA